MTTHPMIPSALMGLLAAAAALDNKDPFPFPGKASRDKDWIPRGKINLPFSQALLTLSIGTKKQLTAQGE